MTEIEAVCCRAMAVLRDGPSAILTDVDGTISGIVPRPEDARVAPAVRDSLERLAKGLALVAVITARAEETARRMVGAPSLTYVGHYGLDSQAASLAEAVPLAPYKPRVRALTEAIPCVTLEDKGVSFSLHYRNCRDPEATRRQLLELLTPIAAEAGAQLLEGKRVIEMAPGALPSKRSAVINLARGHALRGLVYLGDDISDVGVFEEIGRRRADEGLAGLAIAVVDAETDDSVRRAADLTLEGVEAVDQFFARLADALDSPEEVENA